MEPIAMAYIKLCTQIAAVLMVCFLLINLQSTKTYSYSVFFKISFILAIVNGDNIQNISLIYLSMTRDSVNLKFWNVHEFSEPLGPCLGRQGQLLLACL